MHDKKAEWIWGVPAEFEAAGLVTPADKGYQGGMHAKIPYMGRTSWDPRKRLTAPTPGSAARSGANAQLKIWKILHKIRCCPWRAGKLAKPIHVLQLREA